MCASTKLLQIGVIAAQAETTVRTVRYYLEEGLIESAQKSPGGFYLFDPHTVDTVRFIHKLQDIGMSLKDIKALYQVRRENPTGHEAYPIVLRRLQKRLHDVNRKIGQYEELRDELEKAIDLVQQCHGCKMKPNRENCLACEVVKDKDSIPLPFGAIL